MADEVQELQAAVEEVPADRAVEFLGVRYRMADRIGLMPLLKFAHSASKGMNSEDIEGMAAMYAMIRDCIDPGDFPRFEQAAIDGRAEAEELLKVVSDVIEKLSARPTVRPGDSSAGPPATSESSKESSPSPAGLVSVDSLLRSTG